MDATANEYQAVLLKEKNVKCKIKTMKPETLVITLCKFCNADHRNTGNLKEQNY